MINIVFLGILAAGYFFAYVQQTRRYYKTKYKPSIYMSVACFFFALASVFAMLIGAAVPVNNLFLIDFFGRCCVTSGIFGFMFLNAFAVAMTRPGQKTRGAWISFVVFFIAIFMMWTCDLFVEGNVSGIPMFTETSMYKAPYGLPIVETILTLMATMISYPTYLFFRGAKETKDRIVKIKSLLMGSGTIIATAGYALEITGAIPYQYMAIAIPMIMVGAYMTFFGYEMPRQIERIIAGHALASEEMVKSFVEEYFAYPVEPTARTQPNAFSRTLGLDHQQMAGKKILFEFDPASNYETAIQNLTTEALANAEPTIVFTRKGSVIHSALREQKAVKFFCLTGQVSVPTEFSENEMLLPEKDASLMLDVFDKTLKAHPEGNINVVFDSLSDLVMSIGFEKAYRFMKYAIEMLTSSRTTVVFLLNQTAHDSKVVHSLRGLFSNQICFGKEGIQPVKLSKAEIP